MFLKKKTSTRTSKTRPKFDIRRIKASGMEVVGILSLVASIIFIMFPQIVDRMFEHRFRPERYTDGFERLVETTKGAIGFQAQDEAHNTERERQIENLGLTTDEIDLAAEPAKSEFGEWRRR